MGKVVSTAPLPARADPMAEKHAQVLDAMVGESVVHRNGARRPRAARRRRGAHADKIAAVVAADPDRPPAAEPQAQL
jgi:hypothetical protein